MFLLEAFAHIVFEIVFLAPGNLFLWAFRHKFQRSYLEIASNETVPAVLISILLWTLVGVGIQYFV